MTHADPERLIMLLKFYKKEVSDNNLIYNKDDRNFIVKSCS
jgi:hypothetical protein